MSTRIREREGRKKTLAGRRVERQPKEKNVIFGERGFTSDTRNNCFSGTGGKATRSEKGYGGGS